jgi:hypothetical protein
MSRSFYMPIIGRIMTPSNMYRSYSLKYTNVFYIIWQNDIANVIKTTDL